MKTYLIISSLISTLALSSHLAMASDLDRIDEAANTINITQLQHLSQQSEDYHQAYANYRLAITANILGQAPLATQALNDAQSRLETLNLTSSNAENYALLASIYGMQVSFNPTMTSAYAVKMGQALSQAQALEPNNPRVALVEAISAFNTPVEYGGSMQKTITLSSKALDLFANPCDNICWGHAEAYTWRGLAKQNSGDTQGAINDWQAALNVQADYGWANFLLKQHVIVSQ